MRGEIKKSNFHACRALRDIGKQNRPYRIVEPDFSLLRKLRESETGKSLGDGADLENRVRTRGAVAEYAPLAVIDQSDRHAATGRLLEQAVLHDWRELGVEGPPEISERDRRPGRKRCHLRCQRRSDTPHAYSQSRNS